MSVKMDPSVLERPRTKIDISKEPRSSILKRVQTAFRSFNVVRTLSKEQVDRFMKSYVIYDLDWADEEQMAATLGPDFQQEVGRCLSDYYGVLNHLCAIGELEKMYIPPIMDLKEGISNNQLMYEESIAEELELPANANVLDLGCGRGRVAAHIAKVAGASVTGINIDADQIASATAFNTEQELTNTFIRRDFNELPLPLPDAHFDGFYQIQAFSLVRDHEKLLREVHRVLKPGARLSLLDWVSLPAYNPADAHHRQLMRDIKPLIGAVGTPTPQSMKTALERAGFRVLSHGNASTAADGLQAPLIERAETYFETAKWLLSQAVAWGVLPAHFKTLFDRLTKDGRSFIEADRDRLITTSYHWLAVKPVEGEDDVQATSAASETSAGSSRKSSPAESSASSDSETAEAAR